MDTSRMFGNTDTFAIRYKFNEDAKTVEAAESLAYCHLVVNDNLIGNLDEVCYLKTWAYYLTDQKEFIKQNKNDLFPKQFLNLTDREIFESILMANQEVEDFHNGFLYLPKLDNSLWSKHKFDLDETIDAYLFYYYVRNTEITFLIEDRSKSQDRNIRTEKFIFSSVDLDTFIKTIDETISFLILKYPYLKENVVGIEE